jgi:putative sigma-54 modulation protein
MKLSITGRGVEVADNLERLFEKKLTKLDKYFREDATAKIVLSNSSKGRQRLELTISYGGTLFRSEVEAESFQTAYDEAEENIERQIRKNKTRLQKRFRDKALDKQEFNRIESDKQFTEEEDKDEIVRVKRFSYKPMSSEEAILEMNLLGHNFFVYSDIDTRTINVIYRREEGGYGLIMPE